MSTTPLSTAAILQRMAEALPTHQQDDTSSDLASSYEAIALLVHAYLTALGFRLHGLHEDRPFPAEMAQLPPDWNAGFGSLGFVYKHDQSSMQFVFRVDRMGAKVNVRGLAVGDEKIHQIERIVREVVRANGLPVRVRMNEHGEEDRSDLVEKLRALFVSEQVITELLFDLKVKIVQPLIPSLQRKGYVESETAEAEASAIEARRSQEARNPDGPFYGRVPPQYMPYQPSPMPDLAQARVAPVGDFPPPDFEDEHEINHPPRGGLIMPGQSPFNIGHDDLNPQGLGPHDPLRGSFIGGGLPHSGGFSGMHPTFDDPLFTGQGGGARPGSYGPQAPPGARWDPVGPGGDPRFPGPGRGRGGGGNGNPFGGFGGDNFM